MDSAGRGCPIPGESHQQYQYRMSSTKKISIHRDLTEMRTGGQRTAFEILNYRNATIYRCYLLISGQV